MIISLSEHQFEGLSLNLHSYCQHSTQRKLSDVIYSSHFIMIYDFDWLGFYFN